MLLTLTAVIVVLSLGHLAPALTASLRRFDWLERVLARLEGYGVWQQRYGICLLLLPVLLVVLLLQWLLAGSALLTWLYVLAVLAWTWGPRDLDRDVEAVIDADDAEARARAIAQLQAEGGSLHADAPSLVEAVALNALRRWLAVMFWLLVLGPFGAVLYRFSALLVESNLSRRLPPRNLQGVRGLLAVLEWPVVQLAALSMVLVGNFDAAYRAWHALGQRRWALCSSLLGTVACASVGAEPRQSSGDAGDSELVPVGRRLPEVGDAMSLVWRVLLLWLALLALWVIAGWLS